MVSGPGIVPTSPGSTVTFFDNPPQKKIVVGGDQNFRERPRVRNNYIFSFRPPTSELAPGCVRNPPFFFPRNVAFTEKSEAFILATLLLSLLLFFHLKNLSIN